MNFIQVTLGDYAKHGTLQGVSGGQILIPINTRLLSTIFAILSKEIHLCGWLNNIARATNSNAADKILQSDGANSFFGLHMAYVIIM